MRPSSPHVRDLLVGSVLTVATQLELAVSHDRVEGSLAVQHAAFLLITAPVCARRRAPLAGTLVCSVGLAVQTVVGPAPVVGGFVAMLVVLASLGYYASLRRGVAGVSAMTAAVVLYDVLAEDLVVADLVGNVMIAVMAWGGGFLVRTAIDRRVEAELGRDRFARDAVSVERARIARDLHDSIAHALTLMTLQAGGARERSEQPVVTEALTAIEQGGREAMRDMHRFLRLLGDSADGNAEAPGIGDLDDLVSRTRSLGVEVALDVDDSVRGLPASLSATTYRIVQEGLTNAIKHSQATHVDVWVGLDGTNLGVRVHNDGGTSDRGTVDVMVGGRGLAGLRERVALFEGRLTAQTEGAGWQLSAMIPIGEPAP